MTDDMMTINISMPRKLYKVAQRAQKKYHYVSVSEIIRDSLRWWLSDNLTKNGFTQKFERETLKAANDPNEKSYSWDGKGSFTDFMDKLVESEYGASKGHRKVRQKLQSAGLSKRRLERRNKTKNSVVSEESTGYATI
jgi:Arc/MetJ-type ribon-helix-helix transcriptional regulator